MRFEWLSCPLCYYSQYKGTKETYSTNRTSRVAGELTSELRRYDKCGENRFILCQLTGPMPQQPATYLGVLLDMATMDGSTQRRSSLKSRNRCIPSPGEGGGKHGDRNIQHVGACPSGKRMDLIGSLGPQSC